MANPDRRPSEAAAAQRGESESWESSSIQAACGPTSSAGKAGIRGEARSCESFLQSWGTPCRGPCQSVTQRNWCAPCSSLQNDAEIPVQALADDLQNQGNRLGQRIDLGEYPSRGILDSKPPLVILAAGDVVEDDHSPLDLALVIPQGSGIDQHP